MTKPYTNADLRKIATDNAKKRSFERLLDLVNCTTSAILDAAKEGWEYQVTKRVPTGLDHLRYETFVCEMYPEIKIQKKYDGVVTTYTFSWD